MDQTANQSGQRSSELPGSARQIDIKETPTVKQPLTLGSCAAQLFMFVGGPFSSPLVRSCSPAAWLDGVGRVSRSTAAAFAEHLAELGAIAIADPTGTTNSCAVIALGTLLRLANTSTVHPAAFSVDAARRAMAAACLDDATAAGDPWRAMLADAQRAATPNTTVSLRAVAAALRASGVRAALLIATGDGAVVRCDAGEERGPLIGALVVHRGHMSAAICGVPMKNGRSREALRCGADVMMVGLPSVLVGGDAPEPKVSGCPKRMPPCLRCGR